jgi:hypothetical protein
VLMRQLKPGLMVSVDFPDRTVLELMMGRNV